MPSSVPIETGVRRYAIPFTTELVHHCRTPGPGKYHMLGNVKQDQCACQYLARLCLHLGLIFNHTLLWSALACCSSL